MSAWRAVRSLYSRASESRALRRPLDSFRAHPRVRAFARRHVHTLLGPGASWANVDGALRLLSEEPKAGVVFGPWNGDLLGELLYWAPFVRWAREHFGFDAASVAAVSAPGRRCVYESACSLWAATVDGARGALPDAVLFPAGPVQALVEAYRDGSAPVRPLLKRAVHERLFARDPAAAGGATIAAGTATTGPGAALLDSLTAPGRPRARPRRRAGRMARAPRRRPRPRRPVVGPRRPRRPGRAPRDRAPLRRAERRRGRRRPRPPGRLRPRWVARRARRGALPRARRRTLSVVLGPC